MTAAPYWRSMLNAEELQRGDSLGPATLLEPVPDSAFNPDGRYFISYRSVDGRRLADEFQTRLRAAGLSAWRDDADLRLGQIRKRLQQALTGTGPFAGSNGGRQGGLAGAILVATPRVWTSEPVRHVEAPIILQLAERYQDDGFQIAIANAIPASDGGPADMGERVDGVYGLAENSLSTYLMHDATTATGCERIVRHLLRERLEHRMEFVATGRPLRIHVDSRQPLSATEKVPSLYGDNDLVVRLHQERDRRWPAREALEAFATAMSDLQAEVPYGTAVQFSGSIHPSIALALGATFSAPRPGGQVVECLHERGDVTSSWRSDAPSPRVPRDIVVRQLPGGGDAGNKILVMIVATCKPADQRAFDDLAKRPGFKAVYRIALDHWDPIEAGEGDNLARRLALQLATFSAQDDLHVAFVGPWALAVLLGHHLTTTNYVSYEWDNNAQLTTPFYEACLRINPGPARHLTVEMPSKEKP